jgi:tRNA(Ile2) C34 agmatinyltransferase TiaS
MVKNTPPPACPKCGKLMRWMLVKSGGRKYRCIDCELPDPLRNAETARWLDGELGETK